MTEANFLELVKKLGTEVTPIEKYRGISEEQMTKYKQQIYEATGVMPNVVLTKNAHPN